MLELKAARSVVEPVRDLASALEEFALLLELGAAEGEELVVDDLETLLPRIELGIEKLDFRVMLGGPNDRNNAYVQLAPGAGGVDSCDWAGMLMRMYVRWAERRGFKVSEVFALLLVSGQRANQRFDLFEIDQQRLRLLVIVPEVGAFH